MRPLRDDPAEVQNNNSVSLEDGRETMCDDQSRALVHQALEGLLNQAFTRRIQRAGSFIKQHNGRVFQNGTGDGDALTLATGQAGRRVRPRNFDNLPEDAQ